jgi:D-serine deaminase-like pyridoxal phosphate-dependent protein
MQGILERHREALRDLPVAFVDLDAFDRNLARLLRPAADAGKRVRLATKSVRCPGLVRRAFERGRLDGLMTFTARETLRWAWLWREVLADAAPDLLLGYPLGGPHDAALLAEAAEHAAVGAIVDAPEHVDWLAARAPRVAVWLDLDRGWRPVGGVHVGVRRSPLRTPADVEDLADRALAAGLRLGGVMGYEAHVAGLPDEGRQARWQNPVKRWIKDASWPDILARREAVVATLRARAPDLRCNGGGSGSIHRTATDPSVTEVTIGSGLLAGHLFDGYRDLDVEPALGFALAVTRLPAPGLVTCHGGGWIASGAAGPDRLPMPVLPAGCALLPLEGAGEVQTPLRVPRACDLRIGDPVVFRPAKSGELAEVFAEYALLSDAAPPARASTYRGLGWTSWG